MTSWRGQVIKEKVIAFRRGPLHAPTTITFVRSCSSLVTTDSNHNIHHLIPCIKTQSYPRSKIFDIPYCKTKAKRFYYTAASLIIMASCNQIS
jgi:hypothetical protein